MPLAKLRLAGLVTGRREGTFVYYSAANDHVRDLLSQALFHVDHDVPADSTTQHVRQPSSDLRFPAVRDPPSTGPP